MLTKSIIRRNTNSASYDRGTTIYYANGVREFRVEETDNNDYIQANVKGSRHNNYDVRATYDIGEDAIDDIDCECPAFSSYSGICKHCVAVLLEYIDFKVRTDAITKHYSARQEALAKLEKMKGFKGTNSLQQKTAQTTPEMKRLLSNHIKKKVLTLVQDSVFGKVRMQPILKCDSGSIKIEFKIGITHMYVLKDVFEFDIALENNKDFLYGVKLQFVHTIDAFDIESRPLVQFIRDWVRKNQSRYIQSTYYNYSFNNSSPKLREMPLVESELEEVLKAIGKDSILANINGTGEKSWQLTEDDLPREMVINKKADGIEVAINRLFGYQCSQESIYFHEGKIYRIPHNKLEPIMDFLKCMVAVPSRKVYIQREDIPLFCRELLPVLEQHFNCKKIGFDEKEYGILPVNFEIYLDAPQKDFITCKIISVYGEDKFNIYNRTEKAHMRDMVKELEIEKIVSSYCNAFDEQEKIMVVADDEDKIYEFLTHGIPRMYELAEVYVSDALKRLKVIAAPRVSIGVSIAGDLMELKMTADEMSKEQLIEILTKYNHKKKFYRLKNGDFVNVEGEGIASLLELKKGLNLTETQLNQSTIEVPRYRALYLDAELKDRKNIPVTKNKEFKALVRNMITVEDSDFDIPDTLDDILREYQKSGYRWIKTLNHNGFGGILADDMGLGKTLQVICFLLSEYIEADIRDNRSALIVCPASLVFNWNSEFNKFTPQLPVKMVIGTSKERQDILRNAGNKDILITSYDLLKRDIECYVDKRFFCEIIDEAQFIKNHNTQAAKAVKMVKASFKLALTGTPIENRLSELWSIFDYIMPGFLYSYRRFREELETPIVQNQEEMAVRQLQKMITPFVLRRLKKDVLTDLPDKLEENIYVALEGEQQKLYDAHVQRLHILLGKQSDDEFKQSKIQILSELTRLRQICCDPFLLYEDYSAGSAKTEICLNLIHNAISGGHKILLFSQFTSMLDRLQKQLSADNIRFYSLTGATSKENRAAMVDKFNKDDTPVFCISLKAGGTGLNLTGADIVIHYDPWWNTAVQNQATDRAHRIGQENVVNVYRLIVKGTIEENIINIQEKKKELADQILGGEGMNVGSLTKEDLLGLL